MLIQNINHTFLSNPFCIEYTYFFQKCEVFGIAATAYIVYRNDWAGEYDADALYTVQDALEMSVMANGLYVACVLVRSRVCSLVLYILMYFCSYFYCLQNSADLHKEDMDQRYSKYLNNNVSGKPDTLYV